MVTLYATLGRDAVVHGVNESEVAVIITSNELLPKFKVRMTGSTVYCSVQEV